MGKYDKMAFIISIVEEFLMLCYCKKCGRIILFVIEDKLECDCCHSKVYPVPDEFLVGESKMVINNELKQQFINEYIKNSPEFDQYLFDHRDEILAKQSAEFNAKMEHGKAVLEEQVRVPKCPSCGSSNISKIGVIGRAMSFKLLGFASSKIGKTHKCNNCGAMW